MINMLNLQLPITANAKASAEELSLVVDLFEPVIQKTTIYNM
jgi:hypothetical protein